MKNNFTKTWKIIIIILIIIIGMAIVKIMLLDKQITEGPKKVCNIASKVERIEFKAFDWSSGWHIVDCRYFSEDEDITCEPELVITKESVWKDIRVCNDKNKTRICLIKTQEEKCEVI